MIANANPNPNLNVNLNLNFQDFIDMTESHIVSPDDRLLRIEETATGEKSIEFKDINEDKIGGGFFGWRSRGQKADNNKIRDVFLKSVLDRFGASDVSQLPNEIKAAMKLKDYRGVFGWESRMTGAAGSTITGKPLSLRRIRAVVQAVQEWEAVWKQPMDEADKILNDFFDEYPDQNEYREQSLEMFALLKRKIVSYFEKTDFAKLNGVENDWDTFEFILDFQKAISLPPGQQMAEGMPREKLFLLSLRIAIKAVPDLKALIVRNCESLKRLQEANFILGSSVGAELGGNNCENLAAFAGRLLEANAFDDYKNLNEAIVNSPDNDDIPQLNQLNDESLGQLLTLISQWQTSCFSKLTIPLLSKIVDRIEPHLNKDVEEAAQLIKNEYSQYVVSRVYLILKEGTNVDDLGFAALTERLDLDKLKAVKSKMFELDELKKGGTVDNWNDDDKPVEIIDVDEKGKETSRFSNEILRKNEVKIMHLPNGTISYQMGKNTDIIGYEDDGNTLKFNPNWKVVGEIWL